MILTRFLKVPLVALGVYSPLLSTPLHSSPLAAAERAQAPVAERVAERASRSILDRVTTHHPGVRHNHYGKTFTAYLQDHIAGMLEIGYDRATRALTGDKATKIRDKYQNSVLMLLHDASGSTCDVNGPMNIAKVQAQCHLNYLQLLYAAGVTQIAIHIITFSDPNGCVHKSIQITTREEFDAFIRNYADILPHPDLLATYLSPALTHVSKILSQITTEQNVQIAIATDGAIEEKDVPGVLKQIGRIKRPNDLYTIGVHVFTAGALAAPSKGATPKCLDETNPYNLIQPNQARAEQFKMASTSGGAKEETVADTVSAILQDITPDDYPRLFPAAFITASGPGCVMKPASMSIEDIATLLSEKQLLVLFSKLAGKDAFFRELSLDDRRLIDKILGLKTDQHTDPAFYGEDDIPAERIVLRMLREGDKNSNLIVEGDCCVAFNMNGDDGEGVAIVVDPQFVQVNNGMLSATETSSAAYKQLVSLVTLYARNTELVKRERRPRSGQFKRYSINIDGVEVLQKAPVFTITEADYKRALAELQTKRPAAVIPAAASADEVPVPAHAGLLDPDLLDPDEVPAPVPVPAQADAIPAAARKAKSQAKSTTL